MVSAVPEKDAMHDLVDLSVLGPDACSLSPPAVLQRFCDTVGAAIGETAVGHLPARIAGLLPDILGIEGLLTPAQLAAPADGYGRNRVFISPCDRFSVLAMVWPPGVSTPVHDHRDWCALGVHAGEIEETRYDPADASPDCTVAVARRTVRYRTGAVAHLPVGEPNIHRIHNPTDAIAITIHVYGGNCETLGPNLGKLYTVDP